MAGARDPKRALRRQGRSCLTPQNFMDYLSLHRDCEDSQLARASGLTAHELEIATDPGLIDLRTMVYAVMAEVNRMRAFVRLAPLGEKVLYGQLEPEHNTGERVAGILAHRFPGTIIVLGNWRESWVALHLGRGVHHARGAGLRATVERLKELLGGREMNKDVGQLWKTFYQSQYTLERRNMKLFHQAMPKKSLRKAGLVVELAEDGCTTLDDFVEGTGTEKPEGETLNRPFRCKRSDTR